MNKPQFLAELNQYLTFFTPDERAAVMANFTQRFDEAGDAGEAALINELGTPMRVAIDLKRRQESGDSLDDVFGTTAEAPEYSVETETEETLAQGELPPETSAEPTDETSADSAEVPTEAAADESEAAASESAPEPALEETAKSPTPPAPEKLSAGRAFGAALLSIVVAAVFLCVAALGALGITAGGYFIMAGFASMRTLTDALFLFAGGLVLGGVGLLIVWFAIWAAIRLIQKLFHIPTADEASSSGTEKEQPDKERDTK